jgi:hypothetical protein
MEPAFLIEAGGPQDQGAEHVEGHGQDEQSRDARDERPVPESHLPEGGGGEAEKDEDGREPGDEQAGVPGDPGQVAALSLPHFGHVEAGDDRQVAGDDGEHAGREERHQPAAEGGQHRHVVRGHDVKKGTGRHRRPEITVRRRPPRR